MHACSRNARLSVEARAKAPAIYLALQSAQQAVASGSESEPGRLGAQVALTIEAVGGKIDYIEVRVLVWEGVRGTGISPSPSRRRGARSNT